MSQASLSFRKMPDDSVELAVSPDPGAHQDSLVRTVGIFGQNPTAANNSITTTLYSWWSFPTVRRAPVRGSLAHTVTPASIALHSALAAPPIRHPGPV
jgi:hypothetical protein